MADNEPKEFNIDDRELIKTLIYEVEVLKECLVKNNLITREDYRENINRLRESKGITFNP
ncbi:MAG: hypothetical protein ACQ9MH_13970 [Nitrospinales bacterium]